MIIGMIPTLNTIQVIFLFLRKQTHYVFDTFPGLFFPYVSSIIFSIMHAMSLIYIFLFSSLV